MRGLTLLETLVSMFILLSAFVIFVALVQGTLGHNSQIQLRAQAAVVASNHFARIRAWARGTDVARPNFDALPGPFAGSVTDPDFPQFQITTTVSQPTVYSPSTELEKIYSTDPQVHKLSEAYRLIVADVRWGQLASSQSARFQLLLGSPKRKVRASNPVEVTPTSPLPDPLASTGSSATFEAKLLDENNRPIPDATFQWNVWPALPVGGDGSVNAHRNGKTADYSPTFLGPDGSTQNFPNSYCTLRAVTRYYGVEYAGSSPVIHVGP